MEKKNYMSLVHQQIGTWWLMKIQDLRWRIYSIFKSTLTQHTRFFVYYSNLCEYNSIVYRILTNWGKNYDPYSSQLAPIREVTQFHQQRVLLPLSMFNYLILFERN